MVEETANKKWMKCFCKRFQIKDLEWIMLPVQIFFYLYNEQKQTLGKQTKWLNSKKKRKIDSTKKKKNIEIKSIPIGIFQHDFQSNHVMRNFSLTNYGIQKWKGLTWPVFICFYFCCSFELKLISEVSLYYSIQYVPYWFDFELKGLENLFTLTLIAFHKIVIIRAIQFLYQFIMFMNRQSIHSN